MPNPFLGGSLSGLIAARGNINTEGDSPFTAMMKRRKLGRIDEALNQFQAQPRPAARPMQPRPQPRPVAPRPVAPAPVVAPPPVAAPAAPVPVAPGPGMSPTVTVAGGGGGRVQPAFPGFWNALGLGGMAPPMAGPRGYGYGGYGGMQLGAPPMANFRGFSPAQPYQPVSTGGFPRLY